MGDLSGKCTIEFDKEDINVSGKCDAATFNVNVGKIIKAIRRKK